MDKKSLTEQDICSKYVLPAILDSGWDLHTQIREQWTFTSGRIMVHGKTISRGDKKRADFILYYKNNFPIAVVEAKDNTHSAGAGLEQAKQYAEILNIPFAYSTNGDEFVEYDFLIGTEKTFPLNEFPDREELMRRFSESKDYNQEQKEVILQDYFIDPSGKGPRYYQENAINKVVEAVAKGKDRLLLVMATGTGKTYTAFQIIYRLWKSKKKKRILFLVDRTALAQQTMQGDFRHFGGAMTRIKNGTVDKAYEIYVALYQGLTGGSNSENDIEAEEEKKKLFQEFSPNFFDLIVVDECHRGSSNENSAWREILNHYTSATQIGMTATPKETTDMSTEEYFGKSVYTYSLKQGIDDGFLAPYKVIRYRFNNDEWRPIEGFRDVNGEIVPDEIYTEGMFDRTIIIDERNRAVAKCIADFMRDTDVYQKTIVFCVDIAHAERMRTCLTNELKEQTKENSRFIVKITGDDTFGKMEIENFINPESRYPVIATTSKLLSTGVDTKTVKLIVLDSPMNSMTEFKQIIGRGTRVEEQYGKYYFTIMDFRNVTRLFADKDFDGDPVKVYDVDGKDPVDIESLMNEETRSEEMIKELDPLAEVLIDGTQTEEKPKKIRIKDGVDFYPIHQEVKYIDPKTGKLITESLKDFSKKTIISEYASIDEFLTRWKEIERKDIIVNELLDRGVAFEELRKESGKDLDVFDLILHVAYGKKPMTRSERVKKVHANDYFGKYEGKAREIIDLLLTKYTDQGITAIDGIEDLMVSPFTDYGTPIEIVEDIFGGRESYMEVIKNIENSLYSD
ncbi:MAG: DEAD/DEAH box helicase family protein [Candidatus Nomurabacteria bacterium]|nr:DEAD/DEAH box helicase family protein [Candidatus Nomurabacteria bacterium]